MISFTATKEEFALMSKIADRAVGLARKLGVDYPFRSAVMDINACHSNGMPLDLERMLSADDGNFGHDVFGIRRHIDRETGKMTQCFAPRFAPSLWL